MPRQIAVGQQYFRPIRENNQFYIDKTGFVAEWWKSNIPAVLITRPRRFGKSLFLDTAKTFFSNKEPNDQASIFDGLAIWKDESMHQYAGQYPVISLSFASLKPGNSAAFYNGFVSLVADVYRNFPELEISPALTETERESYRFVNAWNIKGADGLASDQSRDKVLSIVAAALRQLCRLLAKHYDTKVIFLLDEYDTPLQEAWVYGYWNEVLPFVRSLMNSTFKDNPYIERALISGITRICKESIFSDLNNLQVYSVVSNTYADAFGFTVKDIGDIASEYDISDRIPDLQFWYDGFTFGQRTDIYNPWSIIKFLNDREFKAHWQLTSDNSLVGEVLRRGDEGVKKTLESLIKGETVSVPITESFVFSDLNSPSEEVWGLLMATGYIRPVSVTDDENYVVTLTNHEMLIAFKALIKRWFDRAHSDYNNFIKALELNNLEYMNMYMRRLMLSVCSYFDVSGREPERFYHGFVLGLLVALEDRYLITSNRESGLGRYDVVLEPRNPAHDHAYVLEFKVFLAPDGEKPEVIQNGLLKTAADAIRQIHEKQYVTDLLKRNIRRENIFCYGFAFAGKDVRILRE